MFWKQLEQLGFACAIATVRNDAVQPPGISAPNVIGDIAPLFKLIEAQALEVKMHPGKTADESPSLDEASVVPIGVPTVNPQDATTPADKEHTEDEFGW